MKCDQCKHQEFMMDDNEMNCLKGHWFGFGDPDTDEDQTLWDNCKDFEQGSDQANDSRQQTPNRQIS